MHEALSGVAAHIFTEEGYRRFIQDLQRNDPITMKWVLLRHLYALYFSRDMNDFEVFACFDQLKESTQDLKALRTRCVYLAPETEYCN